MLHPCIERVFPETNIYNVMLYGPKLAEEPSRRLRTSASGNTVSPPFFTSDKYISTVATLCPPSARLVLS